MIHYVCDFCKKPINGAVTIVDGVYHVHMHCRSLFELKLTSENNEYKKGENKDKTEDHYIEAL